MLKAASENIYKIQNINRQKLFIIHQYFERKKAKNLKQKQFAHMSAVVSQLSIIYLLKYL